MAKKSVPTEVVEATRTIAGAALGAAAGAGAEVVVENAATAMSKGGQRLGAAAPRIKRAAADTVSKPVLPRKRKRSAARRKAKAVKKRLRLGKARRSARPGERSADRSIVNPKSGFAACDRIDSTETSHL